MKFHVQTWGQVSYVDAVARQQSILSEVVAGTAPPTLVLVEHPSVLTLGTSFNPENLHFSEPEYEERGISIFRSGRGGDVTYHGPGQVIAYPIFPLDFIRRDLHAWLRLLEEAVIQTVDQFGVEARRFSPHTGVWIQDRKVCAIGIQVKRWVSMHGIALNCNTDLTPFTWITPCGIKDYGVTSLSRELDRCVTPNEVAPVFVTAMEVLCQ